MAFNPRASQRKFGASRAARKFAGIPPRQELPYPMKPTNSKGQPTIQTRDIQPPPLYSPRSIGQATRQSFSGKALF